MKQFNKEQSRHREGSVAIHRNKIIKMKLDKNNKIKIFLIVSFFLSLSFLAQTSFAMWPVIDAGEIAKTVEVINQLSQEYSELQAQYQTLQNQYNSTIGNNGWGNLDNSDADLKARQWAAPDWDSALKGMSGGNPDRYQQLLSEYQQNHPSLSADNYAKGADQNLSRAYEDQVKTNQASATTATYEFNDINNHLQELKNLGAQIESTTNKGGLKSAIDLNSRIQLETAYVSMEELRMQTLLNQQLSAEQANKIALENEASQYNQAGENPS